MESSIVNEDMDATAGASGSELKWMAVADDYWRQYLNDLLRKQTLAKTVALANFHIVT